MNEFFQKTGPMAIATRMRLLSESMTKESEKIFALYNVDIKPKWYPVIYALMQDNKPRTVTKIALEIKQSHVAVIKTLKEISKEGFLIETKDENDAIATYLTQKTIRIGASRVTTSNFSLKPEKFRKKYVKDYTRIYFHAMVGFGQTLDDVLVPFPNVQNLELYTRYDLNANAKMNPIGAAIGYEYYVMKKMGVSWMAELGVQPGPKYSIGNNVYLDIKLRFHLGMMMK